MATIHLDYAALAEILRSEGTTGACRRAAEQVARNVEQQGHTVGDAVADGVGETIALPVEARDNRDGPGAIVILAHPAGLAIQAKSGVLTRAASEHGMEVGG
jgi:hypothetical protein